MSKKIISRISLVVLLMLIIGCGTKPNTPKLADKPLYRDTIYDGTADPVVIWNKQNKNWNMFYTNRRAKLENLDGVSWVHGTPIGIAESNDGGATWQYKQDAVINYLRANDSITYWAPDVIEHNGTYHMYLTIVPGIFEDWYHPRSIAHFTSNDLMNWTYESTLHLASERCIDASVFQMPDGNWRMYYNNENDGKSMYYADSPDLYNWTDSGKKVVDTRGEGAKIFRWKDKNWMIIDSWRGLTVFESEDFVNWKKQEERIIEKPGTGKDDQVKGGHCDVVVNDGKAFIFYFTHPGRIPANDGNDTYETRRSSIQVAELQYEDGRITVNRDAPVYLNLSPPSD